MSFQRKSKKSEASGSEMKEELKSKVDEMPVSLAFDTSHPMAAKAKAIMESSMPEAQKQKYLADIGMVKTVSDNGKVPFNVYARLRKVPKDRLKAMEVYPKAVSVRLASIDEWDEIFKAF